MRSWSEPGAGQPAQVAAHDWTYRSRVEVCLSSRALEKNRGLLCRRDMTSLGAAGGHRGKRQGQGKSKPFEGCPGWDGCAQGVARTNSRGWLRRAEQGLPRSWPRGLRAPELSCGTCVLPPIPCTHPPCVKEGGVDPRWAPGVDGQRTSRCGSQAPGGVRRRHLQAAREPSPGHGTPPKVCPRCVGPDWAPRAV